ncbi:MAG: DUF975 family protein [Candidatus Cloacimonadaceae bacterium]|jgi:uncharacterized membrane protein|nr:DUF975 family protein [Candidatus Cloacimonadota bacterium]MDX9950128.1 DUF975 family protein [Candidatus Syntrophosphaera sp.]
MNNAQIRAEARDLLQGKWVSLILVWLIMSGITSLASAGKGSGGVVTLVLTGPLNLGLAGIFLGLHRRQGFQLEDLFAGFKDFGRALGTQLLIAIYVFLWMLLLIVPGIIAAISYSMTFFILKENPGMEAQEAMRESKVMMNGHKTEYFMLIMSFIGWGILSLFTLGIGFLFLSSYVNMSKVIFYQRIKSGVFEV